MVTVSCRADQFTEVGPSLLVAEASDLGFPPECWPDRLLIGDRVESVFLKCGLSRDQQTGEVAYCLFQQLGGNLVVRVFND